MRDRSYSRKRWWTRGLALVLTLSVVRFASAQFVMPDQVPVDRLVRNLDAYVQEHPKEAQGHYVLGRVHYLALVVNGETLAVHENREKRGGLPGFPAFAGVGPLTPDEARTFGSKPDATRPSPPTAADLRNHFDAASAHLRRAIELDPDNGLYHLGLGSLLEQGEAVLAANGPATRPGPATVPATAPVVSDASLREAIASYRRAYELSIAKDLGRRHQPLTGIRTVVSYEAGRAYLRLADAAGETADPVRIASIRQGVEALEKKPIGAVTPIVFTLRPHAGLADLLAADHAVRFDLDGTGRGQRWPWVRPDTGILVWDDGSGRVASGRQLFGSVAFWMFWRDGYAALDALDDDRDGELAGPELAGLAVWFDRDGNGSADRGELVSLASLGIEGISARGTSRADDAERSPMNPAGLRLRGGRTAPTYDWTARPLAE